MKGQTIIELKDVKTGEIERHVDNNMMTNAISEIFKTRGLMARNGFPQTDLVKSCLGGILLFDSALTENVSNVFPPTSVTMVGNGAMDVVSTDEVTEMGSYNSNESGWQNDGSFLAVYDFSTSQANGTIASVCLTSDIGGYIGFGNSTSNKRKTTLKSQYQYSGIFDTPYSMDGYTPVRVDYTASTVDMVKTSSLNPYSDDYFLTVGKLKIVKYKIPLTSLSIKITPTALVKVSEYEVAIPSEFVASNIFWTVDDGIIYVVPTNNDWLANASIKILKINADNTTSVINLINTTGETLNMSSASLFFCGSYMIWQFYSSANMYRISLSDSASIAIQANDIALSYNNDFYCNKGGWLYAYGNVINVDRGIIMPCNGYGNNGLIAYNVTNHPLMQFIRGSIDPRMMSLYLASINNLEQAVTKTADKTMKVSYRIMF